MVNFICDVCDHKNDVAQLIITETGEWVVVCTCGERETISL
jgi:hypothetical protein